MPKLGRLESVTFPAAALRAHHRDHEVGVFLLELRSGRLDDRGHGSRSSTVAGVLDGLWVSGADVSSFAIGEVIGLGNGSNVNGGGSPCPCDIGIMFGSPGIGKDDVRLTEFLISSDLDALSVDLFSGLLAGARVTSVGEHEEDGREGSAKLVGVVPEPGTALLLALGLAGLGIAGRRH